MPERRIVQSCFMLPSAMSDLIGRVHPRGQRGTDPNRGPTPTQHELPQANQAELIICDYTIERSFAWAARFRRLARDYERLPETLAGLHFLAFVCLLLGRAVAALV